MTGTYVPISRNEMPSGVKWCAARQSDWMPQEVEHSASTDGRASTCALYMRTRNQTVSPAWNYYAWKAADGSYVADL